MRSLAFILAITFACSVNGQKPIFVRVYDFNGKQFNKGNVNKVTDSSLELKIRKRVVAVPLKMIGKIKTKHSTGHSILEGAVVTSIFGGVFGSAFGGGTGLSTFGEGIFFGMVGGLFGGAAVASITTLFKNSKTFIINGDQIKWQGFQSYIQKHKK